MLEKSCSLLPEVWESLQPTCRWEVFLVKHVCEQFWGAVILDPQNQKRSDNLFSEWCVFSFPGCFLFPDWFYSGNKNRSPCFPMLPPIPSNSQCELLAGFETFHTMAPVGAALWVVIQGQIS